MIYLGAFLFWLIAVAFIAAFLRGISRGDL